ncbi:hypothetical protein [Enterococcus faecium]|uniref:hypothetical protein n=1 Tax=Enterococcus faecium TaxID=1352 RepID=UPI001920B2BF|nr:hypothetical protein [Enterococcus faecium]EHK9937250.1 hypothetical protein [Enterococcus faecium]
MKTLAEKQCLVQDLQQSAIDIAKMKAKKQAEKEKKTYFRILVCWVELLSVENCSKYSQYVQLVETGKSRKALEKILDISFWKLKEFEERYEKEKRKNAKALKNKCKNGKSKTNF